jgi:hypothetical protein
LRAAGGNENTQENIHDWLKLDEGVPGFQLLTEENNFLFIFISTTFIIKFSIYFLSNFFFCLLGLSFASSIRIIANPVDLSPHPN